MSTYRGLSYMLPARLIFRYAMLIFSLSWLLVFTGEGAAVHAAPQVTGAIVTVQFHVHLGTRPFWLDFERPQSRYSATLDGCVDPMFYVVHAGSYDFGNCFVLQNAKPGYDPITLPGDASYVRTHAITYWTGKAQVFLPDQDAHTLNLTTDYIFRDNNQKGPDRKPAILVDTAVLSTQITASSTDQTQTVGQMDGGIPHEQSVHFLFRPSGDYDHNFSFWGCLRRPSQGEPSAYCKRLAPVPDGSFLLDVSITTPDHAAMLFGPDVDPILEGTNVQFSIVAAPPGATLPDAEPAPPGMAEHPASQIITPAYFATDCAADSALLYADQTLKCTGAIAYNAFGQPYLQPIDVKAYVGSLPSLEEGYCFLCASTRPWSYAGAVFLALVLLLIGASGVATLTGLGRIPVASNRPLVRNPMFASTALLACLAAIFLIGGVLGFRAGYQPIVPGQVLAGITPGSSGATNAVPPTPTFTPTPTYTPTPTPTSTLIPSPSAAPGKTPTP
jgi:hypothetical protein